MRHGDSIRIGVIGPAGNMALEYEIPRHLPDGVLSNHTRIVRPGGVELTRESLVRMGEDAVAAARSLERTRPAVILYGCTSGSFVEGSQQVDSISDRIRAELDVPAITASRAVLDALAALKSRSVFLVTPYGPEIHGSVKTFLEAFDVEVVADVSHGCTATSPIGAVDSRRTAELVLEHGQSVQSCDAVLISCTNLLTFDIIPDLESRLDRPVISSNLALLWAGLRHLGRLPASDKGLPPSALLSPEYTLSPASKETATTETMKGPNFDR